VWISQNGKISALCRMMASLSGRIVGYTPACDSPFNEPYIDIEVEGGAWYGVLESQIESIERLA